MTKRMLIDAAHPEETRVVVLDGTRLEEFDLETAHRRPLKGNIYLAKVVRVEPSLQAAFVEYGGNRHGFLAFGEIHPDYYQIPVADRQRLIAMQAAEARAEDEAEERAAQQREARRNRAPREPAQVDQPVTAEAAPDALDDATPAEPFAITDPAEDVAQVVADAPAEPQAQPLAMDAERVEGEALADEAEDRAAARADMQAADAVREDAAEAAAEDAAFEEQRVADEASEALAEEDRAPEAPMPELLGGEDPASEDETGDGESEGRSERRSTPNFLRHYKIQEVIRRRQILLIQVVKEERGSKGAALTTFISLAGRFSVLMPNSPRGGGVSRKITSATDRKRLREAIDDVGLPDGMSLIVRTAGANRPKPEITRDCEYLLRLWDSIRDRTLASSAPALIYEEADLIKRSIRDVFSRDVDELVVEGDDAFQQAREFMRMLMPANAQKVRLHREPTPLFARHGVDAALDAMNSPTVQLRSGGYIVINQTEALVAIDVNSGRATRERHIEDTALRTNLEAAEEIARQLRLRDLAGLIVIDFIDMESSRHDAMVEKRLKDQLRHDRARIQVGRISHFGLLEMSRQRLRPSIAEHNTVICVHCQGRGFVRGIESSALQALRAIEEEGARRRSAEIVVHLAGPVALYLLNRKRERLAQIEERWSMQVFLQPDDTLIAPNLRVERVRAQSPDAVATAPSALRMDYAPEPELPEEIAEEEAAEAAPVDGAPAEARPETSEEAERRRRRRRRRGRGRREDGQPGEGASESGEGSDQDAEGDVALTEALDGAEASDAGDAVDGAEAGPDEGGEKGDASDGRRRRGRRGGRRRRGEGPDGREAPGLNGAAEPSDAAEPDAGDEIGEIAVPPPPPPTRAPRPPRYAGPTPADPFAGQIDDIFSVMEAAEAAAEAQAAARPSKRGASPEPEPAEVDTTPVDTASAELVAETPAPGPVAVEAVIEPVPAPAPAAPEPAAAAPVAPSPVEPVAAAPVQPIVLDAEAAVALPKRSGWWRR
ncbi:ribonuclease E/G [Plastoroseomonas arctica]|uniref:Ribonuclease E n=1 Tax=Plastoroseomonas arctica TaxID=1509237 RepID=A0AAF1JXQ6_9PROT|nr:ribonuclease E/G [Plastoroseomonas arctica]MBR0654428.1 Rne/Rng family ribonuclease [Plastoroseomonas arctica]